MKTNRSIIWGILLIVLGAISAIAGFVLLINGQFFTFIMLGVAALLFLVFGVKSLVNRNKEITTYSMGHEGLATVKKKYVSSGYKSIRAPFYHVIVSFIGDGDGECESDFELSQDYYDCLEVGMKIKCKIYGDSCFIDPNNIEVLIDDDDTIDYDLN